MSTDQPVEPHTARPTHDDGAAASTAADAAAPDPLRGSRTSGTWIAAVALSVVLVLLAVFILQNTQQVEVSLLGWDGQAPLAATLLIAAAGGALVVAAAGALRILQLRRRVKHQRTG